SQSAMSGLVNWTVLYLDETWTHILKWEHEGLLTPERLSHYDNAIYTQGAPTRTVFGWPDCTKFHICQPSQFWRMACNGQERIHCLKDQARVIPNGMIAHLHGPVDR
ncbi:hypothetical protein K439DRAFT_1325637, partial [Ramaria rubella]